MKLLVDREADALYLRIDESAAVVESAEVEPGIILDFDSEDRVVGLEVLGLSNRIRDGRERVISLETAG